MAIKSYEAFKPPSPYEQERRRAEQQRRYAELLQQQALAEEEPFTYQGIRAMPSPLTALTKMLQAYGSKKALEKAEEAEQKVKGLEEQAASQISGRLFGGLPLSQADTTPDESGLAEVAIESAYRQDPMDAMRVASTPQGAAAVKGNPMLAAMLQRSMETPASEEFYAPTETSEGLIQFGKRGSRRDTGVKAPEKTLEPTTLQRDYEFARSQGYTGSFQDFRKSNAPVTNINIASESERKDAYNLARVVSAARSINAATKAEPKAIKPGVKEATVSALPGVDEASYLAQSPQRQIVTAAQTDMIDALLTLATGAAYTKEQLAGQRAAILPRFGESKESIDAKKQRVRDLVSAARVRAGRAWTAEMDQAIETAFGPVEEETITDLPPRR